MALGFNGIPERCEDGSVTLDEFISGFLNHEGVREGHCCEDDFCLANASFGFLFFQAFGILLFHLDLQIFRGIEVN